MACVVRVMWLVMCDLYQATFMLQAMTGRLLSVARDVSGARERAASPSKLPVASAKQVADAQYTWSEWHPHIPKTVSMVSKQKHRLHCCCFECTFFYESALSPVADIQMMTNWHPARAH